MRQGSVELHGVVLSGNNADEGGGLFGFYGEVEVYGGSQTDNSAFNGGAMAFDLGVGGTTGCHADDVTGVRTFIDGNHALSRGGGLCTTAAFDWIASDGCDWAANWEQSPGRNA